MNFSIESKRIASHIMPRHYSEIPYGSKVKVLSVHISDECPSMDYLTVKAGLDYYVIPLSVLVNSDGFNKIVTYVDDKAVFQSEFTMLSKEVLDHEEYVRNLNEVTHTIEITDTTEE